MAISSTLESIISKRTRPIHVEYVARSVLLSQRDNCQRAAVISAIEHDPVSARNHIEFAT
jgi:hypothetical protein